MGGIRDGKPKMGLEAEATIGFDDSDNEARRSGSVEDRGAGDDRALEFPEGTEFGSDGNL